VVEARNGAEALEQWELESGGNDVLLTDMIMPGGVTGLDLGERLRTLQPWLKVIIASGDTGDWFPGHQPPEWVRLLAKPFRLADLGQVVRECLQE
jgi:CheY-like chemotaxis protein